MHNRVSRSTCQDPGGVVITLLPRPSDHTPILPPFPPYSCMAHIFLCVPVNSPQFHAQPLIPRNERLPSGADFLADSSRLHGGHRSASKSSQPFRTSFTLQ